ncbi:YraN family protein [Baaleninema sp.]|uniref:YraN family protein n=1 Tax=Baaleninema sp. TaxID=3101197 RepID=UPI003D04E5C1
MDSSCDPTSNDPHKTGELGEELVVRWLKQQGWQILHRRWRSRWGEIDIIAKFPATPPTAKTSQLIFVEVKTRRRGNWDANGLLSITSQKRKKLWRTAEQFLAVYPQFSNVPCRFDVALVKCDRLKTPPTQTISSWVDVSEILLKKPLYLANARLTLHQYLTDVFDAD